MWSTTQVQTTKKEQKTPQTTNKIEYKTKTFMFSLLFDYNMSTCGVQNKKMRINY